MAGSFDDFLTAQLARIQALPHRRPRRLHREGQPFQDARKHVMLEAGHDGYAADRMLKTVHGWPERAVGCEVETRR